MSSIRERTFAPRIQRCNLCGCDLIPRQHARGLCRKHYQRVWQLIESGKFTEEQLVAIGILNAKDTVEAEIERRLNAASRAG